MKKNEQITEISPNKNKYKTSKKKRKRKKKIIHKLNKMNGNRKIANFKIKDVPPKK